MTPQDRLAEISTLQQGLSAAWPTLSAWILSRQIELTQKLVDKNDDEIRGKIKELKYLLDLPNRLQQEAISLQYPQQEGELP